MGDSIVIFIAVNEFHIHWKGGAEPIVKITAITVTGYAAVNNARVVYVGRVIIYPDAVPHLNGITDQKVRTASLEHKTAFFKASTHFILDLLIHNVVDVAGGIGYG